MPARPIEVLPEKSGPTCFSLFFNDVKVDADIIHGQFLVEAEIKRGSNISHRPERRESYTWPLRIVSVILILKIIKRTHLLSRLRRRAPRIPKPKRGKGGWLVYHVGKLVACTTRFPGDGLFESKPSAHQANSYPKSLLIVYFYRFEIEGNIKLDDLGSFEVLRIWEGGRLKHRDPPSSVPVFPGKQVLETIICLFKAYRRRAKLQAGIRCRGDVDQILRRLGSSNVNLHMRAGLAEDFLLSKVKSRTGLSRLLSERIKRLSDVQFGSVGEGFVGIQSDHVEGEVNFKLSLRLEILQLACSFKGQERRLNLVITARLEIRVGVILPGIIARLGGEDHLVKVWISGVGDL